MHASTDILIAGAGPAGLALAASLAARGVSTLVVDPAPSDPWPRSYGSFESEVSESLQAAIAHRFSQTSVTLPSGERQHVSAAYLRFDTGRLQKLLLARARTQGAQLCTGRVTLRDGQPLIESEAGATMVSARLLVDASAGGLQRSARPLAYQTAYGIWAEVDEHPFAPGEMTLMDMRQTGDQLDLPATFLYALGESPSRIFAQETILCSRKPGSFEQLAQRLHARLDQKGIRIRRILGRENCLIPLGGPLPERESNVLPFGSAARLTQPASGYQLARALTVAPRLAHALALGLEQKLTKVPLLTRGHAALWPVDDARAYALYQLGLETLLDLDAAGLEKFFRAFFALPPHLLVGFMEGNLTSRQVASCMWKVFVGAPSSLRLDLLRSGSRSLGLLTPSFS